MVKIDRTFVYVPIEYELKIIVIVEKGGDSNSGSQIKKPLRYNSYTARSEHQGKAEYGVEYDVYQWSPRKYIGTSKHG